jgi:hypothetical protein
MSEEKKAKASRYSAKQLAGIAPYAFKPGAPSPNPGGRPRQHREMVAKLRENADWIADAILAIIQKGLAGKLTNSDKILSQHIWETWQAMFGRHPQSVLLTGGLDVGDNPADMEAMGGLTALLKAARRENQPKQARPPPDPAIAALTQAEREIPSFAVMLAQVRAESPDGEPASPREVLASLVGEERAAELIGEAVIVVDSAGAAVAPPPAAKPATAPRQANSVADKPAAPAPVSAAEDELPKAEPPPKPAREFRRPSGFPDFDRFSAERARTRAADEERARKVEEARAQGRPQISREEAFPPDPREGPEIVNFTRIPGGRGIRRVGS